MQVMITSYEVCIIDRRHLEKHKWSYLIVDEGQRVKNRNCRLIRELKCLDTQNRLLLSGTPIQNTLEELWSLLNFVNPVGACSRFCSPLALDTHRISRCLSR
jgi:ATP-dependent DNA helicase